MSLTWKRRDVTTKLRELLNQAYQDPQRLHELRAERQLLIGTLLDHPPPDSTGNAALTSRSVQPGLPLVRPTVDLTPGDVEAATALSLRLGLNEVECVGLLVLVFQASLTHFWLISAASQSQASAQENSGPLPTIPQSVQLAAWKYYKARICLYYIYNNDSSPIFDSSLLRHGRICLKPFVISFSGLRCMGRTQPSFRRGFRLALMQKHWRRNQSHMCIAGAAARPCGRPILVHTAH